MCLSISVVVWVQFQKGADSAESLYSHLAILRQSVKVGRLTNSFYIAVLSITHQLLILAILR